MGSFEFEEVVREQAVQANAGLSSAERGGQLDEAHVEEAFGFVDDVIGQLESALAEAREARAGIAERVEEIREALGLSEDEEGYGFDEDGYREYLEGPLEELYENADFAQDDDFANMSAEEVL